MKRHAWILAGTALGLLMAAPLGAAPAARLLEHVKPQRDVRPLILAQAEAPADETEEDRLLRLKKEAEEAAKQNGEAPADEAPAGEAPADEAPADEAPAEEAPADAAPAEEPAAPEAPAPEAPAPEAPTAEEPAAEQPAAEEPAPAEEPAAEQPAEPAPAEEPVAPTEEPAPAEEPAAPEAPASEAPAPEAPAADEPAATEAPAPEQPAAEEPAAEEPAPADAAPAKGETDPAGAEVDTNAGIEMDGSEAPVLDSQKQAPAADGAQAAAPAEPAAPPPADDAAAQAEAEPVEVRAATSEEGTRVDRTQEQEAARVERPDGAEVLREIAGRIVIQFNNNIFVESNESPRMSRGAREVYYEDLPRGRTRETIIRADGTEIVTIRNRYGDVIQRSRITPDGREIVLVYVDERNWDRVDWRDPGLDLPPLRLGIPVDEYVLRADRVDDPDVYYAFLDQPPVERVERLYSVDEVKRSARIRDKTRRVELDTITFDFGSAAIGESQIPKLQGVADAMLRLLDENPAETFLIEGHTDAVGSDLANLALSDRRAEAVANALTDVFGIPPENLATQGYGEEYLKVKTEEPERQNRRVAMRRITPLVSPVHSASAN